MIIYFQDNIPTYSLTTEFPIYLKEYYKDEEISIINTMSDYNDVYKFLENTLDNDNIYKVFLLRGDEYLPLLKQLSNTYKEKCKKIYAMIHRPGSYEVLSIAYMYNQFIIESYTGYLRYKGVKNVHFLPCPTTIRINTRQPLMDVPVLTFCGRGTIELKDITHQHNRYDFYLTLAQASHNLPCKFLYNDKSIDNVDELIAYRQMATHNVLFLDEWYKTSGSGSSAFKDSFDYLLPVISVKHELIDFYRNGLDIGFICDNAEQMLANVHYVSTGFDNNRYMQQIENLKFIREYFSAKALAKRYKI